MTDLNFNDMADPEKLRSVLRERFKGMSDKDLDDMANNDRMLHQLELVEHLYKWQRRHEEILKASGEEIENVDYLADMSKVISAYFVGFVNLNDPIAAISGARAVSHVFQDIWGKAVAAAVLAKLTNRRR